MSFFPCILIMSLLFVSIGIKAYPISLPGCPDKCGNLSIPYPFGLKHGCFRSEELFYIYCDTSYNPPKAFWDANPINVTEIMLSTGEMRVFKRVAYGCYAQNGTLISSETNQTVLNSLIRFPFSYSKNKFTVVGCDTYAYFDGPTYSTGCMSVCSNLSDVTNGTCTGIGCCQTSIPKVSLRSTIELRSYHNHTNVSNFDPCSYAFVVEETAYNFTSLDFLNLKKVDMLPLILDWTIGSQTCREAKKNLTSYACKENSNCSDSDNGPGYRCNCEPGYEGNPYLPDGCQDIDECKLHQPCNKTCINLPGTYKCKCPWGYKGDGKKDGEGCVPPTPTNQFDKRLLIIALGLALGITLALVFMLIVLYTSYKLYKRRKEVTKKKENFKRNGGLLLNQQTRTSDISIERTKVFSSKELEKATDEFNENRVLGRGGQGTVYKGMLVDGTIVAVKKSKKVSERQLQQFINEVVILSQTNHRNVVKLFGSCLETEVPLLIYEYVPNGTLYQHLHSPCEDFRITWNMRLQIATESADAVAYLHSWSSSPIYHRDIKTSNILLDEKYKAKVSDFGTSKTLLMDETHVTTEVQGTIGYLDPEFLQSNQFTEKSDVYSFGIVLLELLTSKKPVYLDEAGEPKRLASEFVSAMENARLYDLVDAQILGEAREQEIEGVADLAKRCIKLNGKVRPTMKEVAMTLQMIKTQAPNTPQQDLLTGKDMNFDQICTSTTTGGSLSICSTFGPR